MPAPGCRVTAQVDRCAEHLPREDGPRDGSRRPHNSVRVEPEEAQSDAAGKTGLGAHVQLFGDIANHHTSTTPRSTAAEIEVRLHMANDTLRLQQQTALHRLDRSVSSLKIFFTASVAKRSSNFTARSASRADANAARAPLQSSLPLPRIMPMYMKALALVAAEHDCLHCRTTSSNVASAPSMSAEAYWSLMARSMLRFAASSSAVVGAGGALLSKYRFFGLFTGAASPAFKRVNVPLRCLCAGIMLSDARSCSGGAGLTSCGANPRGSAFLLVLRVAAVFESRAEGFGKAVAS
jgi:hypothetical protein